MSADPLAIHAMGADLNPYAYVGGDVLGSVDPLGLQGVSAWGEKVNHPGGYWSIQTGAASFEVGGGGGTRFASIQAGLKVLDLGAQLAKKLGEAYSKQRIYVGKDHYFRPAGVAATAVNAATSTLVRGADPVGYTEIAKIAGADVTSKISISASNGDPNDKSELVGAASTLVAGLIAGKFAGQRPSGTGTVFKWPGEAPGGHFSVLVEGAGEAMHTHQVVTGPGQATTIAQVAAGELGVPSATVKVPLANPAGAMAYQRSVLGAAGGEYDAFANSCAQHCARVLNAGGAQVPTGTRALLVWWSAQTGRGK